MNNNVPVIPAVIASMYQPRVTVFTAPASGLQRVLAADSRRYFLRFMPGAAGSTVPLICPRPAPASLPQVNINSQGFEWKFNDCPAITQGEFYANVILGTVFLIVEELYIRG